MNDDEFKKLVVNSLDDMSERLGSVEHRLTGLQLRWAKLVGAASVLSASFGWFAEKIISWL